MLAGCSSTMSSLTGGNDDAPPQSPNANNQIETQPLQNLGAGNVRVGLILSMSGAGNAGIAAQSMRNAAELALAEFNSPNIQLIIKDDGGTAQGAQAASQQAIGEGAEIILGPLFSHAVAAAGQVTRTRSVPMIAFSTDSNVAARGIYLLSFQPENDIDRVISYAASRGKKSITGFVPDNAYGNVVEAAIKQFASARGAKVNAVERYGQGQADALSAVRRAQAAYRVTDLIIVADGADATPRMLQALNSVGVTPKRVQFAGAGLWDDQNVFAIRDLDGAWFAAPDNSGFAGFSQRYQARYRAQPARTASLAYDAVSLVAQLVKTQGASRFTEEVLTNRAGFAGVDGVFRFRNDGTCERSLSIMEIRGGTSRVVQQAPNNFNVPPAASN
ncbi:MAG: penicillin-binding protein activator [Xanthobacteraceae bacterium]|nr:penicillin-binding protein activator [Xanthobacteraceae bacterium]